MSLQSQAFERQALSLPELVDFLFRSWKLILGITVLVGGLAFVAVYAATPIYKGSAELLLETPRAKVLGSDALFSDIVFDSSVIESQIAILKSKSLLRRVVIEQGLLEDPEFSPYSERTMLASVVQHVRSLWESGVAAEESDSPWTDDPLEVAVGHLWDVVEISRVRQSNVIEVTVSSRDARKAAALANALVEGYVADQLETHYDRALQASNWLNQRRDALQKQLSGAEVAVEAFRLAHQLVVTPSGSVTEQQLSELSTALIKAKAESAARRSSYEQVQKLLASGSDVQTVPDIMRSELVSQLRARLAAITVTEADLASRYGDRHPEMIKLLAERRELQDQLSREISRTIDSLRNELEVAESREASLAASLAVVSGQSGTDNQLAVQLRELERIAAADKQLYESLLARAKIAEEETMLPATGARIISAASVPREPSFPRRKVIIALGLVMGFGLGMGTAVIAELFQCGFVARRQVEEALGLPVLASVPMVTAREEVLYSPATDIINVVGQPEYLRYIEAVRGLRIGIGTPGSELDQPPGVIQVTSAIPGEGKTTLAISLARTAAAAGDNVLLIDADLRLGAASRLFEMSSSGLVDVLTLTADIAESIYFDERCGVYILPAGTKTQDAPALLGSLRMETLIGYLKGIFDIVIVDSPPVAPAIDAAILSRLVDKVVFAVKWSDTPRDAVSQALAQLHSSARVAGLVLTMVDERKVPRYGRYVSLERKSIERYRAY